MKDSNKYFSSKYPSKEECFALMDCYGTPDPVKLHCNAVANVAVPIAMELNRCGLNLNIQLVAAAAYLHDIARVHSKHDRAGAEYLSSIGLDEVANVIRNHTFHKIVNNEYDIDETDVLCIADRVVLEDRFVGPEKRMKYITNKALKKFGEEKSEDLQKVAQSFIRYISELEDFIGKKLEEIIQ